MFNLFSIFNLSKKKSSKGYFFGSPTSRPKPITIAFLVASSHEAAIESQHKNKRILAKSELIRFADTGKFKVGDGISFIENIEFSDTLPEAIIMYVQRTNKS